jgi:hypothetical protein
MRKSLDIIEPEAWAAMSRAKRAQALEKGGCLTHQGRLHAKEGQRLKWGAGFDFGSSPVPHFAIRDAVDALEQALALGACPFAKDSEDDGAFEYGFNDLTSEQPEQQIIGAKILDLCWKAGQPLLAPKSPSYLGDHEAFQIQFDIALACFSKNGVEAAAKLGIHIEPSWLLRFIDSHPLLPAMAVQWGSPKELEILIKAGLPLADIQVIQEDPPDSLWNWLEDDNQDIDGIARVLFAAGLDPRVKAAHGVSPLEAMRGNGHASKVVRVVEGLIWSIEERESLDTMLPAARPKKSKAGL